MQRLVNRLRIIRTSIEVIPKMFIAGASAYSRIIDWKKFREIADEVGAILLVDMAHYSGLIAGGEYPNPIEFADVVTSTTHKTIRGSKRRYHFMLIDLDLGKKLQSIIPRNSRWTINACHCCKSCWFFERR